VWKLERRKISIEKERERWGKATGEKVEAKLILAIAYHFPVPTENNDFLISFRYLWIQRESC
jgi:hypothetical protein